MPLRLLPRCCRPLRSSHRHVLRISFLCPLPLTYPFACVHIFWSRFASSRSKPRWISSSPQRLMQCQGHPRARYRIGARTRSRARAPAVARDQGSPPYSGQGPATASAMSVERRLWGGCATAKKEMDSPRKKAGGVENCAARPRVRLPRVTRPRRLLRRRG